MKNLPLDETNKKTEDNLTGDLIQLEQSTENNSRIINDTIVDKLQDKELEKLSRSSSQSTSYHEFPKQFCAKEENKSRSESAMSEKEDFKLLINVVTESYDDNGDKEALAKNNELNTSNKSSESQLTTNSADHSNSIDSLARRVESLIGPVKLDPPPVKSSLIKQETSSITKNDTNYSNLINSRPIDTYNKSKVDYTSLQNELDSISYTLQQQKLTYQTDQKLNKENKPPLVITKKNSLLEHFETPTKAYLPPKIGRDLLHETPMRSLHSPILSAASNAYSQYNVSATPFVAPAPPKPISDTPYTNMTYNAFLGRVNTDCHSSTMYAEKLTNNIINHSDDDLPKKSTATSPIKFIPLSPAIEESYINKYNKAKSPTRSAFDDDPDVISRANKLASSIPSTTISAATKNDIAMRSLNMYNSITSEASSVRTQVPKNYNAFDNATSKLIHQLREVVNRSPSSYEDSLKTRPKVTFEPKISHYEPKRSESTLSTARTDTVESTHTGSDDAKGPKFPSHVYGSREEPRASDSSGIYEKRRISIQEVSKGKLEISELKIPVSDSKDEDSSLLDAENLKKMDKKYKKLIGSTSKKVEQVPKEKIKNKNYAIAWDIDLNSETESTNDEQTLNSKLNDSSLDSSRVPTHPYLPLRDVPMSDTVKKLQRQIELTGETGSLPPDINKFWESFKSKLLSKSENFQNDNETKQALEELENFLKNPAKILIASSHTNEQSEIQTDRSSKSKLTAASTQTSFVAEPDAKNSKRAKKDDIDMSSLGQVLKNDRQKSKVQALIKKQKEEHEKRVKTLEKLAKLERLQAEKLKQIMMFNQTSETIDTTIQASEDGDSTLISETTIDTTIDTIQLDNELKKVQKAIERQRKEQQAKKQKEKSSVQVINLKNTSVYEPPEGCKVIKETKSESKIIVSKRNQSPIQQQTNQLHTDDEGRVFVSIPPSVSIAPKIEKPEKNVKKTQNLTITKRPSESWFQPVTVVSECTREPLKKQQKTTATKPPEPSVHYTVSPIDTNLYKIRSAASSFDSEDLKAHKKLTLREAFEMNNFKFISRSRKRQKEIKLRAEQRRQDVEFKRERIELGIDPEYEYQIAKKTHRLHQIPSQHYDIRTERLFLAQRRQMTAEEIKQHTEKIYKQLPEVKEKVKQRRLEDEKKKNRLKSSIYNKVSSFLRNKKRIIIFFL